MDLPAGDGFVIRTVGDRVLIAGRGARGTLYGAYAFLEEPLGVRWYMPGKVGTVFDVCNDYQRTHCRREVFVPVGLLALVLDEVTRLEHFADIVEVRTHAAQQPTCVDAFGGGLGN